MKYKGKITRWNDDKGFGFVEPNGGGDLVFVHIKAFVGKPRRPADGDSVVYEKKQQKDGRFRAVNIHYASETQPPRQITGHSRQLGRTVTWLFGGFLILATFTGRLQLEILAGYVVVSLITFLAYAWDKSAARNQRWRTRESSLHLLALCGGWPGAFYAQNRLRHKFKKAPFLRLFWLTVALNLGAFSWLMSDRGNLLFSVVIR